LLVDARRLFVICHLEPSSSVLNPLEYSTDRGAVDVHVKDVQKNTHSSPAGLLSFIREVENTHDLAIGGRDNDVVSSRDCSRWIAEEVANKTGKEDQNQRSNRKLEKGEGCSQAN